MPVSKKSGFRPITLDGQRYRWHFDGRVIVVPDGLRGRQVLEVDFGWFNYWDYVHDPETMPPPFSPSVATPGFVAKAIKFAISNGWRVENRGGRFIVQYSKNGGFQKRNAAGG